jgi:hypothetical protein
MKAACPRLFEVEALRDGRLAGVELGRFQSHLGLCPECAAEARALQALALDLQAPSDFGEADELHVRRQRTRLLAAFDAGLMPAARPGAAKPWLVPVFGLGLLSLLGVLAFIFWPARPVPAAHAPAKSKEAVTVRADSSAQWSRRLEAQVETVVLVSGALSIRVDHALSQRRLLVILPDGELEDIGTTFSVSADAGHTTHVTVQDGSVVLRLHGKPPLALGAGDAWSPPQTAAPTPPSAPAPPSTPRARTPRVKTTPLGTPAGSSDVPAADPSADFRAAMAAFNGGDNARAAAGFSAFLHQHSRDPHAEDAAYLRILALQRTGDSAATKQAAQDYLSRYSHGFRHAEVEAIWHD